MPRHMGISARKSTHGTPGRRMTLGEQRPMDEPPVPSIQRYAFVALAAAALFGASAPAAKQLLTDIQPVALAGILYLGSGIGLFAVRRILGRTAQLRAEAPLTRRDTPWLAAAIACGGILAPVLLLWGLARSGAAEASLLLNLEGVLTTLLAAAMFREAVGARAWIATLLVVAGGLALGWQPGSPFRAAPPL